MKHPIPSFIVIVFTFLVGTTTGFAPSSLSLPSLGLSRYPEHATGRRCADMDSQNAQKSFPPLTSSTCLHGNTKQPPVLPVPKIQTYSEKSRQYRRTIYTHDEWVRHRHPMRFFQRAMTTLQSGVYSNIIYPVLWVTFIACATVLWNVLTGTFTDFRGVAHPGYLAKLLPFLPQLKLPMAPFTLSSASLGLLLVFRTNTGYSRWDEARKNWGMNINRTRDMFRMAIAWYDESKTTKPNQRAEDLNKLALCTWAFVRCMKRHLSPDDDEHDFRKELFEKLPDSQAKAILQSDHRPNRALFDLSVAIENLPMHFLRKGQLHMALTKFEDNLGSSERLLTSPVPLFYSRHTARFLLFWTSLLPLALYDHFVGSWNHIVLIPASFFLSTFLYGIEELANQLEEPFTILPQQAFCDKIFVWIMEMVAWKPGDNGIAINAQNYHSVANGNEDEGVDKFLQQNYSEGSTSSNIW